MIGEEYALAACLGTPNLIPPNIAPDISITNFIIGTLVRAVPSDCIPGNAADKIAPYISSNKQHITTRERKFHKRVML